MSVWNFRAESGTSGSSPPLSGLKKTRPFRFPLLKSVVLDWFMASSCLFRWSFTCQSLAVNARNRAKTTKFKSGFLETPVILMPDSPSFSKETCSFKKKSGNTPGIPRNRSTRHPRFAFVEGHFLMDISRTLWVQLMSSLIGRDTIFFLELP